MQFDPDKFIAAVDERIAAMRAELAKTPASAVAANASVGAAILVVDCLATAVRKATEATP